MPVLRVFRLLTARPHLTAVAIGSLALSACEVPAPVAGTSSAAATPTRERAPRVAVPTANGPVDLEAFAGSPVVLHFAQADDLDAWAALDDCLADLEAAGATVLTVTVDGAEAEAAKAFGYTGASMTVVVDGEGTVRARARATSGDDLFALASPVLAEADIAATVEWQGAGSVESLLRAGGLVIATGAPRDDAALHVAADTLAAIDLPADLGTPIAFAGPDASVAASRATRWGYAAVFIAQPNGDLIAVDRPAPTSRPRQGGVRG